MPRCSLFLLTEFAIMVASCGSGSQTTSAPTPTAAVPTAPSPVRVADRIGDAGDLLTDAYGGAFPPTVALALEPGGGAVAAWARREPNAVVAASFEAGLGWQDDRPVGVDGPLDHDGPDLVIDGAGNALAVWGEQRREGWTTVANFRGVGSGWGSPQDMQPEPSKPCSGRGRGMPRDLTPDVVMDPDGNAVAFWHQADPADQGTTVYSLVKAVAAARFDAGRGWGYPELLSPKFQGVGGSPRRAAMAANGDAFVIWEQVGVQVRRLRAGRRWEPEVQLAAGGEGRPDIGVDGSGNAVAAWLTGTSVNTRPNRVAVARFEVGRGWEAPQLLSADNDDLVRLAVNWRGEALAVWREEDDQSLHASRFTPDAGWTPPLQIGTKALWVSVSLNDVGHGLVAWTGWHDPAQFPPSTVWARTLASGGAWRGAELLASKLSGEGFFSAPTAVLDDRGDGFVAWSEYDARHQVSVYASRLAAGGR